MCERTTVDMVVIESHVALFAHHSNLVTLWVNSMSNGHFPLVASRENQAYSAIPGVTGYSSGRFETHLLFTYLGVAINQPSSKVGLHKTRNREHKK